MQWIGAAAVGGAVWSRNAAAERRIAPNDRIVLGIVGVGGMGRAHLERLLDHPGAQIAAVADPDGLRREAARQRALQAGTRIEAYSDFREILERSDIDAVFIATPDHWHAEASLAAMAAGKDVYCEKPLSRTIDEGLQIVAAARRHGRVVQVGTQQRSDAMFRHACELVRNGRIGEVRLVRTFMRSDPRSPRIADEPAPSHLDWDLWLGPAARRPYNRMLHPYGFRYCRDLSGGLLTDWGVHMLDIAQWGCGKDDAEPSRVEAECPSYTRVRWDYGDVAFEWLQGPRTRLDDIEPGTEYGTKFYGTAADLFVNRGGYRLYPRQGQSIDERITGNDVRLYRSPGHYDDFFACMRTRQRPVSDAAIGHRSTALCLSGNAALNLAPRWC